MIDLIIQDLTTILLVRRNELAGLTYIELAQLPEFSAIKQNSLAKLYMDARERMAENKD